jgi:hypothetical protein
MARLSTYLPGESLRGDYREGTSKSGKERKREMYDFEFLGMGFNTLTLQVHRLTMILILAFGAFLFGAIFFAKDPDDRLIRRLKTSSIVVFCLLLFMMLTGIVPDLQFGAGSFFSGTYVGADPYYNFGTVTRTVSDANLGNMTGPLLFDMMEHASFIVVGLAAMAGYLIWHFGKRVITEPVIKRSVMSIMSVTFIWIFVIGGIGGYLVSLLTFSPNQ